MCILAKNHLKFDSLKKAIGFIWQRRRQDFGSGEDFRAVGLVWGPGAELPGCQRNFENLQKNFVRILQNALF